MPLAENDNHEHDFEEEPNDEGVRLTLTEAEQLRAWIRETEGREV